MILVELLFGDSGLDTGAVPLSLVPIIVGGYLYGRNSARGVGAHCAPVLVLTAYSNAALRRTIAAPYVH